VLSGPDHDLTKMVGELALNLHMNWSDELIADLQADSPKPSQKETSDYFIEGKTIRFSSIEARNRCVAVYVFEKNRQAFADNMQMWLSTARDLWQCEIGKADSAAGRLLALVHKRDDIFAIAANEIESQSMQVFDVLHVVEAALPYINNLPVDGIIRLCTAQHERTKNDLAAGILFNKLEKIIAAQPDTCRAIHSRLRVDTAEATASLYTAVSLALAKTSFEESVSLALEDAQSLNEILKRAALWTLGRLITLPMVTTDAISKVSAAVITNMSDTVEGVRQTAINAAAHAAPLTEAFDESLVRLAESGDQYALAAIANTLMLNFTEMKSKAHFSEWVRFLCKLTPHTKGGIDNFDYILYQLIGDESQQQFALSCLTDWVDANVGDTPLDKLVTALFNSTASELAKRPALISQINTEWLLSESKRLASAAAGLLSYLWVHGIKNPEFSSSRLDALEQSDLVFLARRMLGFIYSEEHIISLTMSLLKTRDAPKRTFPIVRALLIDELGQDYPLSTINTLEAAKASSTDGEWITFYSLMLEEINSRMKAIETLPRLLELRPPPSLQRQFEKARAKQMSKAAEEAQKGSVIQQLVTKIPIKAGQGWFSYRDGSYTEPSYMKSISHSVSIPRRHVIDTVGYEISRLLLRLAKRGDP
jgi:hypothetical protein